MKPKKIRIKPERVQVQPRRNRLAPEPDKDWTLIAGAMALHGGAYHYLDAEEDGYALHNPAPGAFGCYIPPPDVAAHHSLAKQSLSAEASYVLDLILNTPAEALQAISTPIGRNVTLPRISAYLREVIGWNTKQVSQTLDELHTYVAHL